MCTSLNLIFSLSCDGTVIYRLLNVDDLPYYLLQVPPAAHSLPSVRVIPDASPPSSCNLDHMRLDPHDPGSSSGLLHPSFRSKSTESSPFSERYDNRAEMPPRRHSGQAPPMYPEKPPQSSSPSTSSLSIVSGLPVEQFGHCPKAREGPALGCNYCWNTTDPNGRILRRKTKYHCPDCQANLCIVPCFQAYHEALEKDKASVASH